MGVESLLSFAIAPMLFARTVNIATGRPQADRPDRGPRWSSATAVVIRSGR
jgi:hypothetical protein